jgi:hypothetical protein
MIDKETQLPLSLLDRSPYNPKRPIYNEYRRGLKASLDYFTPCDRLKVWPNPQHPGRYYVLNGNQRLDLLIEREEERLIAESFGLEVDPDLGQPNPKSLKKLRSDPTNESKLKEIQAQALQVMVDVQIMDRLDSEDAKLFTLTWDRNKAVYDEVRQSNLADEIRSKQRRLVDLMARPERSIVPPSRPKPLGDPLGAAPQPQPDPEPFTPTKEKPWGDPPADARPPKGGEEGDHSSPRSVPPSLIPLMLSLTPEGYREISEGVLRSKARLFREKRVQSAVEHLLNLCGESGGPDTLDSVVVEIALRVLHVHVEVKERELENVKSR